MKRTILTLAVCLSALIAVFGIGCNTSPNSVQERRSESEAIDSDGKLAIDEAVATIPKDKTIVIIMEDGKEIDRKIIKTTEEGMLAKTKLEGDHTYITPCLHPDPSDWGAGCVGIVAMHNGTDIYGGGQYWGRVYYNQTMFVGIGSFRPGTKITSSNEIQANVWNNHKDWARGFELLPKRQWGTKYYVPMLTPFSNENSIYVSIATCDDNTIVRMAGQIYYLNAGDAIVKNVVPGVDITSSNNPIFCTAWNNQMYFARGVTLDKVD